MRKSNKHLTSGARKTVKKRKQKKGKEEIPFERSKASKKYIKQLAREK